MQVHRYLGFYNLIGEGVLYVLDSVKVTLTYAAESVASGAKILINLMIYTKRHIGFVGLMHRVDC